MSLSKTNQLVGFTQQIPESSALAPESLPIKKPFDNAAQTVLNLFIQIQESSSLEDKKVAAIRLHHEITLLRNASLEDRRAGLVANRHLNKKELEKFESSELQRGRDMEAQIDAIMQLASLLLDDEVKKQKSSHEQGARAEILPFYDAARTVQQITSPQTAFEKDWDFAKCLYEEGFYSESTALIKKIPLPDNVQKVFDSIKDSPTPEKLKDFFQVAECAEIRKHIKTVSDEQYRPKTLADVLAQPTIMRVFLKYIDPVALMGLSHSCHESVKQVLPRTYAETHAKKAKDLCAFSLTSAPIVCRNLIPTAVAALCQNGLEYQYLDPRPQNDVGIAKIALISIVQKGLTADFEKLVSFFPEHIKAQLTEFVTQIKASPNKFHVDVKFQKKPCYLNHVVFLAEAFIKKFPNDKDICRIMVQISGCSLKHASSAVQNDPEIVMLAVQNDVQSIRYADRTLKNNDDFVIAAVSQNGGILRNANVQFSDYDAIVIALAGQICKRATKSQ